MIKALITGMVLTATFLFTGPVHAQVGTDCSGEFAQTQYCQNQTGGQTAGNNDITNTLQTVINILTMAVGVAAVIGVIIGGFQMATGGGNPESTAKGRRTIIYSIVGLLITILARAIIVFVLGRI